MYEINHELSKIAKLKIPTNMKVLPFCHVVMKVFRCKSDDKVIVSKHITQGFNGAHLSTYVISPKNCRDPLPCIVFYHGGGFMLKASGAHFQIAKWYADRGNCKVVYPDYRLSPKYPFPIPVEDCFCTYKWVLEHAESLGINKEKIIIAGDSAGGNLAAAVTLMLKDREKLVPKGIMLIYPVTDRRMLTESMKKYTDTPVWDSNLSEMMWSAYLGKTIPEQIQYASPMEAETFIDFPTTHIEVAEFDALRDEGIAFSQRLQADGVSVELHEEKRTCHGFEMALDSSIVQEAMQRRTRWIRDVFK